MENKIDFYYYIDLEGNITYFIALREMGSLSYSYYKIDSKTCYLERVHNIIDIIVDEENLTKLKTSDSKFKEFKEIFSNCKIQGNYDLEGNDKIIESISQNISINL